MESISADRHHTRKEQAAGVAPVGDDDLVAAIRRGESDSAHKLVLRHLPRVRRLIGQLVLDADVADDLTQEVFVSLWRGLDSYRGDAAFTTWLHRIAVNTAYQHLRLLVRENEKRSDEVLEQTTELFASHSTQPETSMIDAERWSDVTVALASLDPPIRTALVLTVLQGMSAGEVAEIEGCPIGTIYWRVHEARRRLREQLKDWFE